MKEWILLHLDENPRPLYIRDTGNGIDFSIDGETVREHVSSFAYDNDFAQIFLMRVTDAIQDHLIIPCSVPQMYALLVRLRSQLENQTKTALSLSLELLKNPTFNPEERIVLCAYTLEEKAKPAFAISTRADGIAYVVDEIYDRPFDNFFEILIEGISPSFIEKLQTAGDWIDAFEAWINHFNLNNQRIECWENFDIASFRSVYPEFADEVEQWRQQTLQGHTTSDAVLKPEIVEGLAGFKIHFPSLGFTYEPGKPCPPFDALLQRWNSTYWEIRISNYRFSLQWSQPLKSPSLWQLQKTSGVHILVEISHPLWSRSRPGLLLLSPRIRKKDPTTQPLYPFLLSGTSAENPELSPC